MADLIRRDLKALRRYLAEGAFRTRRRPDRSHTPTYWYTCCRKVDVEQILEAGQVFHLHWIAGEPGEPELPTRFVTLSAALIGPYRDPFLSVANGDVYTVNAPDVTADTWEAQQPVSSMLLPADLPGGLYQLRTRLLIEVDSESHQRRMGQVSESTGVVQVVRSNQ